MSVRLKTLNGRSFSQGAVYFCDRKLEKLLPQEIRNSKRTVWLKSGESLKTTKSLLRVLKQVHSRFGESIFRSTEFVAIGGGSIGDFVGFIASIYKRGVGLVHVPTTWLAAIDSSVGGKTGINLGGSKNQLGTFYQSEYILWVEDLLKAQPQVRASDALGEVIKTAIYSGNKKLLPPENSDLSAWLWRNLKTLTAEKLKIVNQDPNETKGLRRILNLGHTMGHCIEVINYRSHGESVGQGLFFAIELSRAQGFLSQAKYARLIRLLNDAGLKRDTYEMSSSQFTKVLLQDKKRDHVGHIEMILLKDFGKPMRVQLKAIEVIKFAKADGWVKK